MVTTLLFSIITFASLSSFNQPPLCTAAIGAISPNTPLIDRQKLTLTSPRGKFEMGFFDGTKGRRYVGIWSRQYSHDEDDGVVWVANRDNPLADNVTGVVSVRDDGNLAIFSGSENRTLWSTAISTRSLRNRGTTVAKLQDDGNLLLVHAASSAILWQSFDHPCNSLLPGMKIGIGHRRRYVHNLSTGEFSFGIDREGLNQFFVWKRSEPWWRVISHSSNDGKFIFLPRVAGKYSPISESDFEFVKNDEEVYLTLKYDPEVLRKLMLDAQGQLHFYAYRESDTNSTAVLVQRQEEFCSFDACGAFSVCNDRSMPPTCMCLPGFEPLYSKHTKREVHRDGCRRKTALPCEQGGNSSSSLALPDQFLAWPMQLEEAPVAIRSVNKSLEECKAQCQEDCDCVALHGEWEDGEAKCDLISRLSAFVSEGNTLEKPQEYYLRTASAEQGRCNVCGTTAIHYPLGIGINCGDPSYRSFHCDNSTGQLFFNASDGASYPVSFINEEAHTFTIQPPRPCWPGSSTRSRALLLDDDPSSPFYLTTNNTIFLLDCSNQSRPAPLDCSSSSICHRYIQEAGPPCLTQQGCCSFAVGDAPSTEANTIDPSEKGCSVYTGIVLPSDLSLPAYNWREGIEIGWRPVPNEQQSLRFAGRGRKGVKSLPIKIAVVAATLIVLAGILGGAIYKRRRLGRRKREQRTRVSHKTISHSSLFNGGEHEVEVQLFGFDSTAAATDNFSDSNKLGRGGFGPVYKGKLEGGQEIAVKRLSRSSGQGLAEFKNEVKLIARLQHRNLVRLLGYCIQEDEKLLIYEYMPNKSLDFFIFDSDRGKLLHWEKRYAIIMGVARGLLYLHQDSRLRIIHRDLKTSNILLDNEMNPKISDFGTARIFGGNENEESTNKIVGTYGYMSPEYASHGFFSTKSDVFSFGVIILEIVSGLKNSRFCQSNNYSTLLAHAWQLWIDNKAMHLVDPLVRESCSADEVLKCIQVGLLCVEENAECRPTMATVITIFSSESAIIPIPKKPAFYMGTFYKENFAAAGPIPSSENENTGSLAEGR